MQLEKPLLRFHQSAAVSPTKPDIPSSFAVAFGHDVCVISDTACVSSHPQWSRNHLCLLLNSRSLLLLVPGLFQDPVALPKTLTLTPNADPDPNPSPLLTSTLKPPLNLSTFIRSREDQPECRHFPKLASLSSRLWLIWIEHIASTRKHTRSHKRGMFQSRILHVPAVLRAAH